MTEKSEPKTDYRALMLEALRKIDALEGKLKTAQQSREAIAVVGMGCRFPGAEGLAAYLDLLRHGMDAIGSMPAWRWRVDDYFNADPERPGKMYVREGGFIEQLDRFDADFFGISPREAMAMDPQQRLWLEVCWEALEHANIVPGDLFATQTGVFVGASSFDFAAVMAKKLQPDQVDAYLGTGASLNMLAGRLSYWLGLTGPSMAIDTACSSSLVAVHNACQSLRAGECTMAIAGGVNVILAPETYVAFSRAGMLSKDARCKTFAEDADGFIRSEGCGAVVLKRLSDAEKQGDRIWAVIRGSAVNQDGASGGLTIPSGPSQQAVINAALAAAGVKAEQVGYIEAHGTGTPLGDPIEMRALAACYAKNPSRRPMHVASVKTNLGHLEAAAGIAGLIKTVLSLHEAELFPHLHFSRPSSHIDWQAWPVNIPLTRQAWPAEGQPRLAAVSSFGLSGTNAHLIIEQAPPSEPIDAAAAAGVNLLLLSAKTLPALQQLASDYATRLFGSETAAVADICYTANSRRSRFAHRLAVTADSAADFKSRLLAFAEQGAGFSGYRHVSRAKPRIGFAFTGQGSQWPGMAAQLYDVYPEFSRQIDCCDRLLRQFSTIDLKRLLLEPSAEDIHLSANAQPALFAFEYALAKQWQAWGVNAVCLIGHSLGEYVAACIAGVFDLEQGLRLIVKRAELMQEAPGRGGMAAVFTFAERLQTMLADFPSLSIAAYNSPENQVVSGDAAQLSGFLQVCAEHGLEYRRLNTSHGFHSPCMQPVLTEFAACFAGVALNAASIPMIANLTGGLETAAYAQADYWLRHLRQPVLFQQSLDTLARQDVDLWLEIGPKPVLTGLIRQQATNVTAVSACPGNESSFNQALAEVVASGLELNWQSLNAGQLTDLPTYPWQRQRYWPDWYDFEALPLVDRQGRWLSSPAFAENSTVYAWTLSLANQPWLSEHRVYGLPVAPLALLIATVYQALFKRDGHRRFAIVDLEITRALLIPEGTAIDVQLIFSGLGDSAYDLKIVSREEGGEQWRQHVSAGLQPLSESSDTAAVSLDVPEQCDEYSAEPFYRLFAEHGLQYGPRFRGIASLWQQPGRAVARLDQRWVDAAALDATVLDSALQLMAAVFEPDGGGLRLPVRIRRIECWRGDFADSCWASATLNDSARIDLAIFNAQRQLQFSIAGVEVATVSESRLKQMLSPMPDWFYQPVWRPHRAVVGQGGKSWLFIAGQDQPALVEPLIQQGHRVSTLNFDQLSADDLIGVNELVDLSGFLAVDGAAHAMEAPGQLLALLPLLQGHRLNLTLTTRNAQGEFCRQMNYGGAALWGMAAVLFQEHSELKPRIIDADSAEALLAGLLDNSGEQRLAAIGDRLWAQRLQRHKPPTDSPVEIDQHANYLVSGGLGDLGLTTACWLIEQGARHLYLSSRREHARLPSRLLDLQGQYADLELIVMTLDVCEPLAVERLFAAIEHSGRPLKGIVHCAGFTDDDLLLKQSASRLAQLNRVKLQAAVLLDQASRRHALDFFWLYSSLNALLGNVGQGAYAAANAAMDALAWQRGHDGFPALAIDWGPWQSGIQQQSSDGLRAFWRQSGLGLIDGERAGTVLQGLLGGRQTGQVCVVNCDWRQAAKSAGHGAAEGLLAELMPAVGVEAVDGDEYLRALRSADSEQSKTMLGDWLKRQLAGILKLSAAQCELSRSLSSLGLDSLAAVELRAVMRKTLQTEVPVSELLQCEGWGLVDYLQVNLLPIERIKTASIAEDEDMLEGEI
ncbi:MULTISPECIES: type I polyketide synthase [Methylomonas]|uniref:Carrier domain-containing protein n=1 Tax=Methylomonas koyamae TaxID=702114 RepID=A0A177NUI9_9GAMM|nr:type I polyketide synthase [Methylomonas koyamae]OAI20943.1 hypothetical protein A1355_23670 [Methylomonas koyamae]